MNRIATPCKIRRFTDEDAARLHLLMAQCGWGPYRDGIAFGDDDLIRGMEENAFVASFVVETPDGELVGWAALNAVSVQHASAPGGVFVDHLVIHPDFRNGVVTGQLMAALQAEVLELGYRRIDSFVEAGNVAAMVANRRVGLRQVVDAPCEDGGFLMECHMPMLLPYLRAAGFTDRCLDRETGDPRLYMKALRPPGGSAGSSDVRMRHGAACVSYEFHLGDDGPVELAVDRTLGAVTAIRRGDAYEIEVWPVTGRALSAGSLATLTVDIRNLGTEPLRVTVEPVALSGSARPGSPSSEVVAPGEVFSAEVVTKAKTPGRCRFDVEVVIERDQGSFRWPVSTWFETLAHPSSLDASWWSGCRGGDGWALDLHSGVLSARRNGRVVLEELWPDVGPPFPGGHKDPIPRRLSVVAADERSVVVESPANGWIEWHPTLAASARERGLCGIKIERRLSQLADCVLRVDTTVRMPRDHGFVSGALRTWPRIVLDDARLVVPDLGTWAVGDELLPWANTNFEFVRGVAPTSDPAALGGPWAIFAGGDCAAGTAFPGATEVRFGGRWMPSVLYTVEAAPGVGCVELPPYYLIAGEGVDEVLRQCEQLVSPRALAASEAT